jgi:hypothetical protein
MSPAPYSANILRDFRGMFPKLRKLSSLPI